MKSQIPQFRARYLASLVLLLLVTAPFASRGQITVVWQDNFDGENVWDNWSVDNGVWEIGRRTSWGLGTDQIAATVLELNYPANTSSRLIRTLPFVVPSASQNPRLQFSHYYAYSGSSYGVVQIKHGTNNWTEISPRYYATGSGVWTRPVVDLKAYAGKAVQIAFQSVADGNVADGWYLNDIRVVKGDLVVGFTNNAVESFENGLGDWYAETGTWEVGVPTSGPGAAHTGTNCLATVLSGNYTDDRSSRFVSPAFVVPAADQLPRLRFWQWWSFNCDDYGQLQISTNNGASWQALSSGVSTDSYGYWSRAFVDLTVYAGQTVQLGFYFYSHNADYAGSGSPCQDGTVDTSGGWYVDALTIETGALPTFALPDQPEGFEGGWGNWRVDYIGGQATDFGIWEIGVPTSGPGAAHGGTNCAATVLSGNYQDDRTARLVSPAFVVPAVGQHPQLRFWHWFAFNCEDLARLQVKPLSSGAWTTLAQYGPATSGGTWTSPSFDLSLYAGQTIQVGLYFESHNADYAGSGSPCQDGTVDTSSGWYVDDMQVTSVTPPTGIVEFTDARYFVSEGGGSATISVARKYGSAGAASVTFMATDGTAVGGDDFDSVVDTLSWADSEQGVKTITVPINQDALVEGNETVSLQLIVPPALASSVAHETATLVIVDDDGTLPLSTNIAYLRSLVGTTNWVPANTTNLFTVEGTVTTYTNLSSTAADELFFMQDNTNGIAVLFRGGTNQFMPQMGDLLRVTAGLTNINGLLALAPNYSNITNVVWRLSSSNALPTPAALNFADKANVPVMEGAEARYVLATNVWVSQTGGAFFPTTLANVTLTNAAGLTFDLTIHPNLTNAGQIKPTAPVTIVGVLVQNDPTSPYTTNYSLLPTEIQGGSPGVVQFTASDFKVLESVATVTLTASRTVASSGPISVSFGTVNGTALAGTDFAATNGMLSWADGEGGTKSFTVWLLNDGTEEVDKTFTLGLSGATVGPHATATITIVNDDFVARPVAQALPQGTNTTLSVTPTANSLGYQWWKDGSARANATNATLALANLQISDGGNYWAVVTTTAGAVTSSVAQVVIAVPVSITQQPLSQTALAGSYVSLTVGVSGTAPYTYQWRRNGVNLSGATNASLVFNSVQVSDAADYSVVVNNPANVPTNSAVATLTVFGGGFVPAGAGLGDYTVNNGLFSINAGGEDIEGTEDRFFFVYTPLVGDGQIVARLIGLTPADPQSEAGVMLRDGDNGGSRHAFVAFDARQNSVFRRRLVENDYSVETPYPGTNMPWMRLTRMGDTFIGHYSTNGVNWDLVWWTTLVNMPQTLEAGLAVTAHKNGGTATALFTNVSVGPLLPLSGVAADTQPKIHLGGEYGGLAEFQRVGGFKALVTGRIGGVVAVRGATALDLPFSTGALVAIVTNEFGVVPFVDSSAFTNSIRFYRAVQSSP